MDKPLIEEGHKKVHLAGSRYAYYRVRFRCKGKARYATNVARTISQALITLSRGISMTADRKLMILAGFAFLFIFLGPDPVSFFGVILLGMIPGFLWGSWHERQQRERDESE